MQDSILSQGLQEDGEDSGLPQQQNLSLRKGSLNLRTQRKAVALYNAPVVKERYKRVISHFNKPKNSFNAQRLDPLATKCSENAMTNRFVNEFIEGSGIAVESKNEPKGEDNRKVIDLDSNPLYQQREKVNDSHNSTETMAK